MNYGIPDVKIDPFGDFAAALSATSDNIQAALDQQAQEREDAEQYQAERDAAEASGEIQQRYSKPSNHVIEGWQNKKFSDSAAISSMTPFIKLYCIYSSEELQLYENVLANNKWMREQPDQWLESGRELFDPKLPDGFVDSLYGAFQIEFVEGGDQGSKRVINSIISKSEEGGGIYATDMTFAIPQGPDNNWDGGFGVIDMQSTKMTDTPFVENFSMKIQLNNPRLIKQKYEFNKLITVGSHFLIMYGWSDGSETGLYDAENKKIFLDTNDEGFYNKGNWRWTIVQLHKFNFNFNDMGQMEGTLDFISAQNSDIIFNMNSKMSNISQYSMYFLNSRFLGGAAGLERAEATVGTFDEQGNELDYQITQEATLTQSLVDILSLSVGQINLQGLLDDTGEKRPQVNEDGTPWEKYPKRPSTFINTLKAMSGYYGECIIELPRRISLDGKEILDYQIAGWWVNGKGFIYTQWFENLGAGSADSIGLGDKKDIVPTKAAAMSFSGETVAAGLYNSGRYWPIITGRGTETIPGSGGIKYVLNQEVIDDMNASWGIISFRFANVETTASEAGLNASDMLNVNLRAEPLKFAGHELWEEIEPLLTCSVTDKNLLRTLDEGVSVVTMNVSTTGNFPAKIFSEDIIYYNLGWVIASIIYYNNKIGSGALDVRFGLLSPQLRVNDSFRTASTNVVRNIYAENNKDVEGYDRSNFKSLIKASEPPSLRLRDLYNRSGQEFEYGNAWPRELNYPNPLTMSEILKTVEKVEAYMVDKFAETRSLESDWIKAIGNIRGIYYNELLSYFSGEDVISATKTSSNLWSAPDAAGIQTLVLNKIEYSLPDSDLTILNHISENVFASGLYNKVYRKGEDIFLPQGMVIPFYKTVQTQDRSRVNRAALNGITNINRIIEIPMEANRVDEVFANAVGTSQSPADIINKILTDCCAIDGLGLSVITKSNGSLVIEATGGMQVETEQFNMDYTEEELNRFSEGDNFILDYRSKNSLIKNLTVGGTMDPNISFLYGNSIRQHNSKATILSAINQRSRTNPNDITFTEFAKNWLYQNQEREDATQVVTQLQQSQANIDSIQNGVIGDENLSALLESLPDDLYSAYLATDYTLYEQLQIEQMNSSNSVNSLFTYYMNQITAKIHGTTGLECFQIIQLKNVAGLIDGFYCIIGITDQITTSSFETELKLMLLAPSTVLESRLQT